MKNLISFEGRYLNIKSIINDEVFTAQCFRDTPPENAKCNLRHIGAGNPDFYIVRELETRGEDEGSGRLLGSYRYDRVDGILGKAECL